MQPLSKTLTANTPAILELPEALGRNISYFGISNETNGELTVKGKTALGSVFVILGTVAAENGRPIAGFPGVISLQLTSTAAGNVIVTG